MKTLTLFRHAKSSWKYPVADLHRPLNGRGLQQALHMASHCQLALPDKILSSPASRAISTAMIYVDRLRLPHNIIDIAPSIYEAGDGELIDVISTTDDSVKRLWLFGHNPGLNMLLDRLLGHSTQNLVTAAYAHLQVNVIDWRDLSQTRAALLQWNDDRG